MDSTLAFREPIHVYQVFRLDGLSQLLAYWREKMVRCVITQKDSVHQPIPVHHVLGHCTANVDRLDAAVRASPGGGVSGSGGGAGEADCWPGCRRKRRYFLSKHRAYYEACRRDRE